MTPSVAAFYDALAPHYHLIFADWDRSIAWQGDALAALARERVGSGRWRVLDAAVGIGTQALGLAGLGFDVVGSDLSRAAVLRAGREAARRALRVRLTVADFRRLPLRSEAVDVVMACDNALPHLLTEDEIAQALRELIRCLRPGGCAIVTLRDYGPAPPPGTVEVRPYGGRDIGGRRYRAEQEWRWNGPFYELRLRVRVEEGGTEQTIVEPCTTYFAIPVTIVAELMRAAGFEAVERRDDVFYQPLLVGTRPP